MFHRQRDSEETPRPSLSTIPSDDGRGHHGKKPIRRVETAPASPSTSSSPNSPTETRTSNSLKRKPINKSYRLARSETLSSKPPLTRVPSVQTRYMEMLLHLDEIPRISNISASLFTWIILAGFLVVPGTFTTFKESEAFRNADDDNSNEVAHSIVHSIANIGLLWVSGAFCVIGTVGCAWLWFRWRQNYVWLINRIFL